MTRAAVLVLLALAALGGAGCGAHPAENAAARLVRDRREPPPRPVRWHVSRTPRLNVETRTYTVTLPGYTEGILLEVATDADGDGRPDVEATATRTTKAGSDQENLVLFSHAPLRSTTLAAAVARQDMRVVPLAAPQPQLTYIGDETTNARANVETDQTTTHYRCGEADCGLTYTAVRVTANGSLDVGGGWVRLAPRPPEYPAGTVWALGDWNGDYRTDFLAATIAGTRVLAPTADGVGALPVRQLETPSGRSLAFPVAADLDGDGRSEVVGFSQRTGGLSLVIVAPA